MKTFVYFVQPVNGGPVKIGVSKHPQSRLSSLMSWSPFRLRLLATAPGDEVSEGQLHHRFAKDRLHGEWFRPSPDLMALVEETAQTGRIEGLLTDDAGVKWQPGYHVASALPEVLERCSATVADLAAHCGLDAGSLNHWMDWPAPKGRWSEIIAFAARRGVTITCADLVKVEPLQRTKPLRVAKLSDDDLAALARHLRVRFGAEADWRIQILTHIAEQQRQGRLGERGEWLAERLGLARKETQRRTARLIREGYLARHERHSRVVHIPAGFKVPGSASEAA